MEEKKQKLLSQKEKLEDRIKNLQGKLKKVNQEIENIELQEKSKSADEIVKLLESRGITDVNQFIELIKAGKISIQ